MQSLKGIYGLLIALSLGLAGMLLNWSYLARRSRDLERESFLGIRPDVTIRTGDLFQDDQLVPVDVPKNRVGNLRDFAVLYSDKDTVIGGPAVRDFEGGQLILRQDLRTPPPEPRALADDEREIGIPVDTRTFVPALYKAGDWISFVVPRPRSVLLDPNSANTGNGPTIAPSGTETIGPFEIRTIGNRVASSDLSRASRLQQVQENVLNIIVKMQGDELEPKAQKLSDLLLVQNVRQFVILGHPRPARP